MAYWTLFRKNMVEYLKNYIFMETGEYTYTVGKIWTKQKHMSKKKMEINKNYHIKNMNKSLNSILIHGMDMILHPVAQNEV